MSGKKHFSQRPSTTFYLEVLDSLFFFMLSNDEKKKSAFTIKFDAIICYHALACF